MTLSAADIRALEERTFNAWPALQTVLLDGWVFRFANGYTKRANSVNALAPLDNSFASILPVAETLYAEHGLPPIFRITPLTHGDVDARLAEAGYFIDDAAHMSTTSLSGKDLQIDPAVTIHTELRASWCDGFTALNQVSPKRRATHDQMLTAIRPSRAFAVLEEQHVPVAYGVAVMERGTVGLFDIVTAPAMRRKGYGRRLVETLLAWGQQQGATNAYLQVVTTNTPALALYDTFGFRSAYSYHFRIGKATIPSAPS